MENSSELPEGCISNIISLTSPRDACRLSLASCMFKSASESDLVWKRFLPSDYMNFISQSLEFPPEVLISMPKKDLYFHLCNAPIIIGDGNMSFSLDKESGKKCFMVGAKGLTIIWGGTAQYWKWKSLRESRFSQVADLWLVWWLHVYAKVETSILSPQTTYEAYFIFKLAEYKRKFDRKPVQLYVHFEGREDGNVLSVYLDPAKGIPPLPRNRGDGWNEIKMGEFFNDQGEDGPVSCNLRGVTGSDSWSGLIVEGIELRPQAAWM